MGQIADMIELPFPPSELYPNKTERQHHMVTHRAKKKYKDICKWMLVGKKPALPESGPIYMTITMHPPDKRNRDKDGVIGACKYLQDSIAEMWGVNDSRFDPQYHWGDVVKGGKITVKVLEI